MCVLSPVSQGLATGYGPSPLRGVRSTTRRHRGSVLANWCVSHPTGGFPGSEEEASIAGELCSGGGESGSGTPGGLAGRGAAAPTVHGPGRGVQLGQGDGAGGGRMGSSDAGGCHVGARRRHAIVAGSGGSGATISGVGGDATGSGSSGTSRANPHGRGRPSSVAWPARWDAVALQLPQLVHRLATLARARPPRSGGSGGASRRHPARARAWPTPGRSRRT